MWNLPLKHPVNIAYEAATVDLDDANTIDPFHLEAYGTTTVNYNRDVEIFPVLKAMMERISGTSPYQSPTDMGVNMAGNCIVDDAACCEASRNEIVRRYLQGPVRPQERRTDPERGLQAGAADESGRADHGGPGSGKQAHARSEATGGAPAAAIELSDGTVITRARPARCWVLPQAP